MLETLRLEIGGFFDGIKEIHISTTDGVVHAEVKSMFQPEKQRSFTLGDVASAEWLSALEAIHINRWRSRFEPPNPVLDGEQWEMDYKVAGKRCRHFRGDNAYPENWQQFLHLLETLGV